MKAPTSRRSRKRFGCQCFALIAFLAGLGNYWHLSQHHQQQDTRNINSLFQSIFDSPAISHLRNETPSEDTPSNLQRNPQVTRQALLIAPNSTDTMPRDFPTLVNEAEQDTHLKTPSGSNVPISQHVEKPSTAKTTIEGIAPPNSLLNDKEAMSIFNYAPRRIPGYISTANDTIVLYGHVMREFTRRICARQIAQSTVLVVSPEAPAVVKLLHGVQINSDDQEGEFRRKIHHRVGGSTLIHAHRQGHTYHGLDPSTKLNDWQDPPGWILLAMFDHFEQNDDILSNATRLFQQSTITYVVLGIGVDVEKQSVYGMEAVKHLLDLKYKVQILSLSHFPTKASRKKLMSPNVDVTLHNMNWVFNSMLTTSKVSGAPVYGYLFATQGLDLAIPTATEYNPTITTLGIQYKQCPRSELVVRFPTRKALADKFRSKVYQTPYIVTCEGIRILLENTTNPRTLWMSGETEETSEALCVRAACGEGPPKAACATRILPKEHLNGTQGNENNNNNSTDKSNLLLLMLDPISRARFERSLPKTHRLIRMLNFTSFQKFTAVGNNSGPNQAALYSGMPLASRNSISSHNQQGSEWLWETLQKNGYATFKSEDGCVENSNMIQSIQPQVDHGEALFSMTCFDFSRPNCIGNKAAAQHLIDYGKQFINAYEEQNQPWAAMMHFIDSHEDTQILEGTLDDPLFRFLFEFFNLRHCREENSGVHCSVFENTMIVLLSDHGLHYGSYLLSPPGLKERSKPMLHLKLPRKKKGEDARAALQINQKLHTTPFDVYETIVDVLNLNLQAKLDKRESTGSSLLQPLPPNRRECHETDGVPSFVCEILKGTPSDRNAIMPEPPSVMSFYADIPPTNKVTRPICNSKPDNSTIFTEENSDCLCATNRRGWYKCTQHPWAKPSNGTLRESFAMVDCVDTQSFEIQVQRDPKIVARTKNGIGKGDSPLIHPRPNVLFLELDSVSTVYADRHLPRTRELLNSLRLQISEEETSGFTCQKDETFCAVEFEQASVVGPSSIPNQLAVFGACIVTVGPERCDQLDMDAKNRTICTNTTSPVFEMELIKSHRTSATFCPVDPNGRSPWIFDIAREAGYVTLFAEEFCYDGSIYVPQGNIFPLRVDLEPGKFFCRTSELRARRDESVKNDRPKWMNEYQARSGKPNCVHENGVYDTALVALDHVESMWNSYHDIPKFAYVNAIAAHEYGEFRVMAEKSETYDFILSAFIKRMLARADATNTIMVVRADHGLQAGPVTSDYSIQIEALRPWTEIIVPKNLQGLSLDILYRNRQKLVTGFDFYKTLTNSILGNELHIMPEPPAWSTHLWQEEVSETRTCLDVKVSNDYCLFEGQRTFSSPNLRSCNLVEDDQRMVCPLVAKEFLDSMSEVVGNSFYTTKNIKEKICPESENMEPPINQSLADVWKQLDDYASQRPQPPFDIQSAPPPDRQAVILSSIVADLSDAVFRAENRSLNVCQTGFDLGHTAAMFLEASPHVNLQLFARLNHTTQTPMLYNLLSLNRYYKRVRHFKCDSCLAMLDFGLKRGLQCDFLHGLRATRTGYADTVVDLVTKSPCGVILSGPAASLRDKTIYFGMTRHQWSKLRADDCIGDIHCFTGDKNKIEHKKFCMAITTGKCQSSQESGIPCDTKIAELSKRIALGQICPAHEVPVPPPLKSTYSKAKSTTPI